MGVFTGNLETCCSSELMPEMTLQGCMSTCPGVSGVLCLLLIPGIDCGLQDGEMDLSNEWLDVNRN